ncbi:small multi-drug export protein [Clostridioides sp. ES-S-0108-01]|uniref:COG2426 family protein n=1 Tax=Clostridioides sp. ES-S-0108-01 TaxID=2770773 RepID=UPI001D0C8977|nr:small multi-drug export protein [Clostridioides sp. ES-S-0108-01]UDN50429.1 small multi-drug export protein [Clostridioides sp. ES-S-0107-01]
MEYVNLVFFSMIPIIELRGAIPIGISLNLNPLLVYLSCLIGSTFIGIPIILTFRYILNYLKLKGYFCVFTNSIENKIHSRARKLKSLSVIGLILFVGIPLPTTGAWSAAGIASLLEMRLKDAILGIFLGNALSGLIIFIVSYHIF